MSIVPCMGNFVPVLDGAVKAPAHTAAAAAEAGGGGGALNGAAGNLQKLIKSLKRSKSCIWLMELQENAWKCRAMQRKAFKCMELHGNARKRIVSGVFW